MGLRETAALDARRFLENSEGGFGWPITVTDPAGVEGELTGFSTDIGYMVDPDTGAAVSGRQAEVSISIAALADKGLGIPVGIADETSKKWLVAFNDSQGVLQTYSVIQTFPDRALDLVVCLLGGWKS